MYNPASFQITDKQAMLALVAEYPLGLLITNSVNGLSASPLPFICQTAATGDITLVSHMARANDHWKTLTDPSDCLVVFQGPQNYVTPSWYASKPVTHKVVPTWNYATVQMRGQLRVIEEPDWLLAQVSVLTAIHEAKRNPTWQVSDAPDDYIANQLKAIVGIEIRVSQIEGKQKMSQNRLPEDVHGVISGLSDETDPHHNAEVAAWVAAANQKP